MKFTVTMECDCGEVFHAEGPHLTECIRALAIGTQGDPHDPVLNGELERLIAYSKIIPAPEEFGGKFGVVPSAQA